MQDFNFDHLYTIEHFSSPILLSAKVTHGFQRGSKELGVPTANLCMDELGEKGNIQTGIYYGWACLNGQLYECVSSVGWNPFYNNTKKTIEAHLLVSLEDFYGEDLKVLLCGYLRNEANFSGVEELIACIHTDIAKTKQFLVENATKFKDLCYFEESPATEETVGENKN